MTSPREARRLIFEDTLKWIKTDQRLFDSVKESRNKTRVYLENEYPEFEKDRFDGCEITVSKYRSFEAAEKLHEEYPNSRIAVMNFANAFEPGGGVVNGAGAQEECLCRCSTLYPVINTTEARKQYYDLHRNLESPMATDALIYSEDILVIKSDTALPERLPEDEWFSVDVMTVAAPDMRDRFMMKKPLNNQQVYELFVRRITHVLTVAAHHEADVLVLGAFGCGAFYNDPELVAEAFKQALEGFENTFKRVEFAIYCADRDTVNYEVFRSILGE